MIHRLVYHIVGLRKPLSILGASSLAGTLGYFGIVKPVNANSKSEVLIGALAPMDKRKNGIYETAKDYYFVHEFNKYSDNPNKRFHVKEIPSLSPSLKLAYLDNSTKHDYLYNFSESIQDLVKAESQQTARFEKIWRWDGTTIIRNAYNNTRFFDEFSTISDRELTYRSIYFMLKLNSLTYEQLGNDILWSLAEEAIHNRLIIRPDSISINMELQDLTDKLVNNKENYQKWLEQAQEIPIRAKKVNNFKLSFKIFNPQKQISTILRSIPVDPLSESTITVTLPYSELRPFSSPIRGLGFKAVTWGLVPVSNHNFHVAVESSYPFPEYKVFYRPTLNLIHGRSKYFEEILAEKENPDLGYMHIVNNTPTYGDLKEIVSPMLTKITTQQIKEDLETWYGSVFAKSLRMKADDAISLIDIIQSEVFEKPNGEKTSFLSQMIENNSWRQNFYSKLNLNSSYSSVIDTFFDPKTKHHVSKEDLNSILNSTKYYLKKIADKITVSFTWEETPEFANPLPEHNSIYPNVKFKFKQKITWDEDIKFAFKGCFKNGGIEIDESKNSKNDCSGDNSWFDLSDKLQHLKEILTPVMSLVGGEVLGINVFNTLIPDATKFIGWEAITIKKNESIETIYQATNSQITPAITSNPDVKDENGQFVLLGWKALDVNAQYNLSNFTNMFQDIYSKIDSYDEAGKSVEFTLPNYQEEIQKAPISFVAFIINRLFKQAKEKDKEAQSPWKNFFNSLLGTKINVGSTQLFAGYSRAFFDVSDWVLKEGLENQGKQGKGDEQKFKTKEKWGKNHELEIKNKFPAKAKNPKVADLLRKMHFNLSTFFPFTPMVFEWEDNDAYNDFLEREGSSSDGFIHSKSRFKEVLKEGLASSNKFKNFPHDKYLDWEGVKLNFYRFEFEKAFKSVLATYQGSTILNLAITVAAGSEFSIPNILGAAIERDAFLVTMNMLLERGSFSLFKNPINFGMIKAESVYNFTVGFKLDPKKLNAGKLTPR